MVFIPRPSEKRDPPALRVLHVVQKYSSGVGTAIAQYTRSLPEVEHHLLSGTPVDAEGDLAEQAAFASVSRMSGGHRARLRQVRDAVRDLRPQVVHAHSSHGGAYARLAVNRRRHHLVYTPHCYAFERRDVSPVVRAAFWLAEALLAINTSAFAACSERERDLSAWPTRHAPRYLVPNIAPLALPGAHPAPSGQLVVGGGRLSRQKDPDFFLAMVRQLRVSRPGLHALWLGDDDASLGGAPMRGMLEAQDVEVSGWLPRAKTLDLLGGAQLYLHSARWEGFPLMVAEAVALGVPTLVRRQPSFAGLPPDVTVTSADDVRLAHACLADPVAASANLALWARALEHNTADSQRAALTAVYLHAPRPSLFDQ